MTMLKRVGHHGGQEESPPRSHRSMTLEVTFEGRGAAELGLCLIELNQLDEDLED